MWRRATAARKSCLRKRPLQIQRLEWNFLRGKEKFTRERAIHRTAAESLFSGNSNDVGIIIFLRDVRQYQVARAAVKPFWIG